MVTNYKVIKLKAEIMPYIDGLPGNTYHDKIVSLIPKNDGKPSVTNKLPNEDSNKLLPIITNQIYDFDSKIDEKLKTFKKQVEFMIDQAIIDAKRGN